MTYKLSFIAFVLSFFGFASCHDTGPDLNNTITALKDSIAWTAQVRAVFEEATGDSLITIIADAYYDHSSISEDLDFTNIPPRAGLYTLHPHTIFTLPSRVYSSLYEVEGGDVLYATYKLDTTMTNWLSIESYDPISRKIVASFQASYISPAHNQFPELKTTFTEGKIMAVVED